MSRQRYGSRISLRSIRATLSARYLVLIHSSRKNARHTWESELRRNGARVRYFCACTTAVTSTSTIISGKASAATPISVCEGNCTPPHDAPKGHGWLQGGDRGRDDVARMEPSDIAVGRAHPHGFGCVSIRARLDARHSPLRTWGVCNRAPVRFSCFQWGIGGIMRDLTVRQAKIEIEVLDQVRASLEEAIRNSYQQIRANNPRFGVQGGDIELAAGLHNVRLSQTNALEEIARRGYGRVAFVSQIDDAGKVIRSTVYRVSQANANLPEASIVARNGLLGSAIASCKPGEEFEVTLAGGERFYIATALIEIEGAERSFAARGRHETCTLYKANFPEVDVIPGLRAFVDGLSATRKPGPRQDRCPRPQSEQNSPSK